MIHQRILYSAFRCSHHYCNNLTPPPFRSINYRDHSLHNRCYSSEVLQRHPHGSVTVHEHFPNLYTLLTEDTAHNRLRFYEMLRQVDFNTPENRKPRYKHTSAVATVKQSAVLMCFLTNPNIIPPPIRLLVLQKQPKNVKRNAQYIYGGQPCFPGGTFDAETDRTLQDTAIRETVEELGNLKGLQILNSSFPEALTGAGVFSVKTFIATFDSPCIDEPFSLQQNEIAHAFEIDLKRVIDGYEKQGVVNYAGYGDFVGPVFRVSSKTSATTENRESSQQQVINLEIWGYTASIIEKFCKTIEQEMK